MLKINGHAFIMEMISILVKQQLASPTSHVENNMDFIKNLENKIHKTKYNSYLIYIT